MSDVEFEKRVRDLGQAVNERTPKNWRCLILIAETDSERQSMVCNLSEERLRKVLQSVLRALESKGGNAL